MQIPPHSQKRPILVTGFEPFDGMVSNHSWDVARAIAKEMGDNEVMCKLLPVDEEGSKIASRAIELGECSGVLHFGIAMERKRICIEIEAKNKYDIGRIDNSGRILNMEKIVDGAPERITTTLSRHVIDECIEDSEDLVLSSECGGYICNETYFRSLNSVLESNIHVENRPLPVLFIHLPPTRFLPLDHQIEAVSGIAEAISAPPVMLVVGALLRDSSGRILSCRRPPEDQWSGWWEFPGGKVSKEENLLEAVSREVTEELGIHITPGHEVARELYRYEDRTVDLRIIDCGVVNPDSITLIEHDASVWLDRENLNEVKWLPADTPIIEAWMANGLP